MLHSFDFARKLNEYLGKIKKSKKILNYNISISLNQTIIIYIVSDFISCFEELLPLLPEGTIQDSYQINFEFLSENQSKDEEYAYLFEKSLDFGFRRSLQSLLGINSRPHSEKSKVPIITFYSHKGGVGRTTALALFANHYALCHSKRVFIIDCDFEAPGLINFYKVSQYESPKNGLVEYLNDKKFIKNLKLSEDYFYELPSEVVGDGKIFLMPAGNIFGQHRNDYLEGLAKIDMQGEHVLCHEMRNVIEDIINLYEPDVILLDSRTGFNNIFASLFHLSDGIVGFFGDDEQNKAGLEFFLDTFASFSKNKQLFLIFSIVSSQSGKRFTAFKNNIENYFDPTDGIKDIPQYYFSHQHDLEVIGTSCENFEEVKFFLSQEGTQYHAFFTSMVSFISSKNNSKDVDTQLEPQVAINSEKSVAEKTQIDRGDKDEILNNLVSNFPERYAENIKFDKEYFYGNFYIRQCMQDLFLQEYKILLGGKGTGKTAFYLALQNEDFFELLIKKSHKEAQNFKICHVISKKDADFGFIEFSAFFAKEELSNEVFVRKLWTVYLWLSICVKYYDSKKEYVFRICNDKKSADLFKKYTSDENIYDYIEEDLKSINKDLLSRDERMIITFDMLDYVVKPDLWNEAISPLVRLCDSNSWKRIYPKLFIRRDLFEKLANITNKQALESYSVSLEWTQEEMFAFLFKIIFSHSHDKFLNILSKQYSESFLKKEIEKKLDRPNQFNQLPCDRIILEPLAKSFFGYNENHSFSAYDSLYNNLKNADRTISLRPFLDLLKLAAHEQLHDTRILRSNAILDIYYCTRKSIRSKAVENHFLDLANEAGNNLIKHFVYDIKDGLVSEKFKYSSLLQRDFEELVYAVQNNHEELKTIPISEFERILKINGIIFTTIIPGGIKKYSFAFLYKYYMDLKPPKKRNYTKNYNRIR